MRCFGTGIPWHVHSQTMSKHSQSWLICNPHRRTEHLYLTDLSSPNLNAHFSILQPNCKFLWAWKMLMLSGWDGSTTGEGDLAGGFCWLFTRFQWLILLREWGYFHNLVPLTLSITPLTSSPWLYVSFHLPVLSGSKSTIHGVYKMITSRKVVLWSSPLECLHVTETAHAEFYTPSAEDLCEEWVEWQTGNRRNEGDTVIPPLWIPTSRCNAGWCAVLLIHLAFLWTYLHWTDVIEGIPSEAMILK